MPEKEHYLKGRAIDPQPITSSTSIVELVDNNFLAYNAARLREVCQLFADKMLEEGVTVGMSLSGALTPAGLGMSAIIPLIEQGFVDWIVSTGANLYHDTHFGLGLSMHCGSSKVNDVELYQHGVVRIYDILFDYQVLISTDKFFRQVIAAEEFQHEMGTAEFHYRIGRYIHEREKALGLGTKSLLSAAYQYGVPVYTSSPGDSSIGLNVAEQAMEGSKLKIDVSLDVNETTAIVWQAKRNNGKSGVFMLGGGSPKNFVLQTEPQIQEVLGMPEKGHDYYLQITDARPDSGGLSGATPAEGVTWKKVDPDQLPHAITCYLDSTVGLPIVTAYALAKRPPRKHKRLYDRREELYERLKTEYLEFLKVRIAKGEHAGPGA